jgi:hypothetical protein
VNSRSFISTACLILLCACSALADTIILKDGREFSGKLVHADANVVDFRIQGKVETFNIPEVAQIIFKEPELLTAGRGRTERPEEPKGAPTAVEAPVAPDTRQRENPPAATPPPAPPIASITLAAGTPIIVRTVQQVDTDQNKVGESFEATLEEPLTQDGQVVAQRGARVMGRVAYAEESGRASGQSQLILELTELVVDGKTYPLRTSDHVEVGAARGKRAAAAASGGAVVGAIIGAIAGGGKGAAIGAAAGAGAGAGVVLTRGRTLKVPAETVLKFELQKPLTMDAP